MTCFKRSTVILTSVCFLSVFNHMEAARILVVAPTPLYSHQAVFRSLTQQLVRRGHNVVALTTDPAFPPHQAPQNLTEIDLHDISYNLLTKVSNKKQFGKQNSVHNQITYLYHVLIDIFKEQMQTKEVREMLADKSQQFDLVIAQSYMLPALTLAHFYHAPAILMSTFGIKDEIYEYAGVPTHPILYPDVYQTSRHSYVLWEKARALYQRVQFYFTKYITEKKHNNVIRELNMKDVLPLHELMKKVDLQFVNLHPMWEGYRPMTLNVVHLGGIHYMVPKSLPAEEWQSLMDSSKHGVIYMSFGSHADPDLLPPEFMAVFARVFATLPYDVLWKWGNAPDGLPSNVHTFSWLPQDELLRHEKLLLFITQGGLQSTDEALRAGVPLLGIPLLTDQWFNVDNYERFGVGLRLDLFTITEIQLKEAIDKLINDKSYRERAVQLNRLMLDQPQTSLERAIWWAERTIRLRGRHMPTPPPSSTWDGLIQALFLTALVGPLVLILVTIFLYKALANVILTCRCVLRAIGETTARYTGISGGSEDE